MRSERTGGSISPGARRWLVALAVTLLRVGDGHAEPPAPSPLPILRTPPALVGGVRAAHLPEDPTSFTRVIEIEEFAGEAKTLTEIVADSVGVQVRSFGGPGDRSEISIRGSTSSQVVVLLDGVRLNTAQSGAVDLSTLPRDLIERIEISRGGGSIQTGSDAIGGVINVITRAPSATPQTTASFSGGSWDTYRGSLTHSGGYAGLETMIGYDGFGTNGDWEFRSADRVIDGELIPGPEGRFTRVNNDSQRHSGLFQVARDVGETVRLRATDSFLYESGGEPGPDSGGGSLLGQSTTAERTRIRNLADVSLAFADVSPLDLAGDTRLFYRYDRSDFEDDVPRLGPPVDSDNRNHSFGSRNDLRGDFALGFSRHLTSLGVEGRGDWLRSNNVSDQSRWTVGVFAQDEIQLFENGVRLVPALRFDHTDGFGSEWLPRVGLLVRLFSWLEIKGNVEQSYRVPNFDELYFDEEFVRGNPNLDPEEAFNADIGLELGLEHFGPLDDGWLELAFFRNDIDESIVFQPINAFVVAATNTGSALAKGVELAGGFRLFRWLAFSGNWTHLDTEADRTGQPLPGRAEDEYFLRLELGPPSGLFKLVGEHQYTSDLPVTADGGTTVSSRRLWNASAALDIKQLPYLDEFVPGERLLVSVSVDNLSDQSVRDAQFYPQPGRFVMVRVEWQL